MRDLDRRIGILFAGFLAIFSVAFVRAAWIQGVEGGSLSAQAKSQHNATIPVPGKRGAILDRNGTDLAVSQDSATIFATPYQLKDPTRQVAELADALDRPVGEIEDAIANGSAGFAYIARGVDLRTARKVDKLGIEGVGSLPDSSRVYPQGPLAGQVIGAVGTEAQGLAGLEILYDQQLHGTDGEFEVVRDAQGDAIDRETVTQATNGARLKLTIDASIQAHVEQALAEIGETYQPQGATAIVMDARNSQVLAMGSWPPVDPARLEGDDVLDQLINRATATTFEPGSTFKAFTVAGALEQGLVEPDTSFNLGPTIEVADRVIEEAHERGPATLTTSEIIAQSSNVGAITIGMMLGPSKFNRWVGEFGFGAPTGVTLPGEEAGVVLSTDDYSGSTMGNLPIGQGLSVTPIQMAAAFTAIANGGILRTPQLVLRDADGREPSDPGKRIISRKTADELAEMLEGVLGPGGTAPEASVPGYVLAGKTGTAQKVVDGTYSDSAFVASFIGFAPADDPRIVVSVAVDEPTLNGYYGGVVAAPAFSDIAAFTLPYLGIEPD